MTAPTRSIRSTVTRRIFDAIVAAGVEVLIPTMAELPDEFVMVLDTTGDDYGPPTSKAGRLHRQDDFTIRWLVRVATPGLDAWEARDRCEELARTIDDVLADDATLNGLAGLQSALVTNLDGPDALVGPEGWVADATVDVAVKTRLV